MAASCPIEVRFAPQAQGASNATLTIATNAVTQAPGIVLSGTDGPLPQGITGATGGSGATRATGATGPRGPRGPAGQLELVSCTTIKVHGKNRQRCATKLTSRPVKFKTASATLARGRVILVLELGDPRVHWLRRVPGSGSHAGPNALGRRFAVAPVVAYLGQDDVWDNRHLEALLAGFSPGVDVVHGVTLYLEEPSALPAHATIAAAAIPSELGGGSLRLACLSPWRPEYFVPPSSLAHRRGSRCVGDWPDPSSTGWPVDCAFLLACHARTARFASSQAPTVFKYAAALRPDSYKRRDVTPQRAATARLKREPGLGDRLLALALAAGIPGDAGAPPSGRPGAIADHSAGCAVCRPGSALQPPDGKRARISSGAGGIRPSGMSWERSPGPTGARGPPCALTRQRPKHDSASGCPVRHAVVPEQLSCLRVVLGVAVERIELLQGTD